MSTENFFAPLQVETMDLNARLSHDPVLIKAFQSLGARMAELETNRKLAPHQLMKQREKLFGELWVASGRNSSLLTPYFMPRYPGNKPFSLRNRPFNMALMYLVPYSSFTLRGSRQTGKTVTLGCRIRMNCEIMHNFRTLYVAPHQNPLETFARKYIEIGRAFINQVSGSKYKQNMNFLEYPNRNTAEFLRIMSSATPSRGKTADELIFDECLGSETAVRLEGKTIKIVDLVPGDRILAFDEHNNITTDTVRALRNKGRRHTWRLHTSGGSVLECTPNEKLRTPRGWMYAAELLTANEDDLPFLPGGVDGKSKSNAARHHARGRGFLHSEGQPDAAVQGQSRAPTERILLGEIPDVTDAGEQGAQGNREQGVRENFRGVQHKTDSNPELPEGSLLEAQHEQARLPEENGHAGVGGPADLGSGGLVVHGRRLPGGEWPLHLDPLVLQGGGGAPVRMVDYTRLPGLPAEDQKGAEGILGAGYPDRVGEGVQGEGVALHPSIHALQAGFLPAQRVQVYVLRGGFPSGGKENRGESGNPVLSEAGVQEATQPGTRSEVGGEARPAGKIPQGAGAPVTGPGTKEGAEETGHGEAAGTLRGSGIPGEDECVEAGIPAEAQGRGEPGGAAPDFRLPVLREGVHQHEGSQDAEALPDPVLSGTCLSGAEARGHEPDAAGPPEGEEMWRMIPEEIVRIEYAGEQEVWDIETERHHTFFANGIAVHNCQLFDPALEIEVGEVLNDSDIKSILYTGTSTTTDTLLEQRYQEGTQGTWNVLTEDGGHINCGDPEAIIPCIGPYFLLNPKTGNRLDPLRGFYSYGNPEAFLERRYSVHIPQILNPKIANNPLEWNGLYKILIRDRKKFTQEKLGIPVEEADSEITLPDLKRICVNPDGPAARLEKARKRYYKQVVSAFDWGGSDYEPMTKTKISHTVHSILGVAPDNKVDILHIRRHGGKDYKDILNQIVADHHRFGAGPMASDFGGGQTYHMLLRSHPLLDPSRHVVFDYDDPGSPLCASPRNSSYPNMLMLNRTESLTMLFMSIVAADPILRAPSWDEMEDYLQDFLHMKRVLTDSEKGVKGRRFVYRRHSAKSDDVVHSLNLGYALLMLCNNQALVFDQAARNMIRNSVYGNQSPAFTAPSGIGGWASALSEYARG